MTAAHVPLIMQTPVVPIEGTNSSSYPSTAGSYAFYNIGQVV